jgi:hypothetical protein
VIDEVLLETLIDDFKEVLFDGRMKELDVEGGKTKVLKVDGGRIVDVGGGGI